MYPVSDEFKAQIRDSHRAVVRAEVWRGDTRVLTLEPLEGSVDLDSRRGVRRMCTLTVAAPNPTLRLDRQAGTYRQLAADYSTYAVLSASASSYGQLEVSEASLLTEVDAGVVPGSEWDPLAPFGNELRLWRGITTRTLTADETTYGELAGEHATYAALASGSPTYGELNVIVLAAADVDELVPLGVFLITNVRVDDQAGGARVTVQGADRSLRITRARWTEPYSVSGNVATAVQAILEDRWDDVVCDFTTTDETINTAVLGLETSNDPWKDAVSIAAAAGLELYFDGDGVARLVPVRDYTAATADATYRENAEAMVLTLARELTAERTYNGVIASGEGSEASAVFRGEAWDDDPASPTYRYGPFGLVPLFYSSPLLTSDDMADRTAASLLAKKRGAQETIQWTQVVDPSLDAGDVVAVANTAAKVNRLMVLDRLTIPLGAAEAMAAVSRTIRTDAGLDADDE